jgi:hypothetical protein
MPAPSLNGWIGEYSLHPVVDELDPATHYHLWGQHRKPLVLEKRPSSDAGLGEYPGESLPTRRRYCLPCYFFPGRAWILNRSFWMK